MAEAILVGGGDGLSKGKLEQATAEEDEVFVGKTFYSKSKELRTGTYDKDWAIKVTWPGGDEP